MLIAKEAVDSNLRISKKFLNRLLVISIILAEKCYAEEQNTI